MNSKILKIATAVTAVIMMTAFTDVPNSHWAYNVINESKEIGLIKGVSEELYEPDRDVSKQEMALILYRVRSIFNSEISSRDYSEQYSSQIAECGIADWAEKELAYGLEKGFWNVSDFSNASADRSASRQLIAKWLFDTTPNLKTFGLRVFKYKDFGDIDPAYYPYVDAMYKYGIMRGDGENFNPVQGILRAEAAAVAVRMKNIMAGTGNAVNSEPIVYETGKLTELDTKKKCFMIGDVFVNIAEDVNLLIDGKVSKFSALSNLKNKDVVVSLYLNGENVNNVVVQSMPVAVSGTVNRIVKHNKAEVPHETISINVGGTIFDYVRDAETDSLRTISEGDMVSFIADGVYLLEIK